MRRLSASWLICSLLSALAITPPARGEYAYQYVITPAAATVAPGGSVVLAVALRERVTGTSVSRLATDGLFSAGVRLTFGAGGAGVAGAADIAFNPAFDGTFRDSSVNPGISAQLTESVDFASPAVRGTDLGNGVYQVALGSFRVTAGSAGGVATTFTAADIPGTSDTLTDTGFVLDGLIQSGTATITTTPGGTAVPEPTSAALLAAGLAACIPAGRLRGRR